MRLLHVVVALCACAAAGCRGDAAPTWIGVSVDWPGASPADVEASIALPIEDALAPMLGVERMVTTSGEGWARVSLKMTKSWSTPGAVVTALTDARARLERIHATLPPSASPPVLTRNDAAPALRFVANAPTLSAVELTRLLDDLAHRLETVAGVAHVDVENAQCAHVAVVMDGARMAALGVTQLDVAAALARGAVELPGGAVAAEGRVLTVRSASGLVDSASIADVVVRTVNGAPVRVRDVADVRVEPLARHDDARPPPGTRAPRAEQPDAPALLVWRQAGAGVADVQRAVLGALSAAELPASVTLSRAPFVPRDDFLVVITPPPAAPDATAADLADAIGDAWDAANKVAGMIAVQRPFDALRTSRIGVDRERAAQRNVPVADIARTIAAAAGDDVATVGAGSAAMPVALRMHEDQDIAALFVRASDGAIVPLVDLVTLSEDKSPHLLQRRDRQRVVTFCASSMERAAADVKRDLEGAVASVKLPAGSRVVVESGCE